MYAIYIYDLQFSQSVQSLSHVWLFVTHELQHARPACPSPAPRITQTHVHRVSDAIQPSHSLLSASPSAPVPSQHQSLFQWVKSLHKVAKVLGVSALASVLPKNNQDWSPLEWTGWISLQSKGLSRVFSNSSKAAIFQGSAFFTVQLSHPYMTTGKTIALTRWTFVGEVINGSAFHYAI